jgi:DNA-binding HxlR family transcriptional regulator
VSTDEGGGVCSVERALALVGDRWTLLIMRELSFGVRRFDSIQANLKVSSYLLSTRLKGLEKEGVIERRLYMERPARHEYYATPKGLALDPLLINLRAWCMEWGGGALGQESAVKMIYKPTGETAGAGWHGPNGQPALRLKDFEVTFGDKFKTEREATRAAFRPSKKKLHGGSLT